MPTRKKTIKKKVVKHKATKRKSSFSFKKLLAPFLVLAGVAVVLSYTILPKTSVLSSQVASQNSYGQALSTGGVEIGEANGLVLSDAPLSPDGFSIQFYTKVDPGKKADVNYILRKPLHANNADGGDLLGLSFYGSNPSELILSSIGTGGVGLLRTSNKLADGKWHNVIIAYRKNVGTTLYIDHEKIGTIKDSANLGNNMNNLPIYFGFSKRPQDVGYGNAKPNTSGLVFDDIAVMSKLLSSTGAPQLPASETIDTVNLGLWHLDGNYSNSAKVGKLEPIGDVSFVDSTVGVAVTPTPSESSCGNITLGKFTYADACSDGKYKSYTFECTDGFGYTIGGSSSACRTLADFKEEAYGECSNRTATCVVTPTPFPTKTPTPKISTPTPTKKVAMCKATMQYMRTKTACRPTKSGSTMGMDFGCSDGYVGTRTANACTSIASWTAFAKSECSKRMTPCR